MQTTCFVKLLKRLKDDGRGIGKVGIL